MATTMKGFAFWAELLSAACIGLSIFASWLGLPVLEVAFWAGLSAACAAWAIVFDRAK